MGTAGRERNGGPIAHIGHFREEFVVRRRWIDERAAR
jgi:chromate transport protein ChrA